MNPDLPTWNSNRSRHSRHATISRNGSRPTSSRNQDSPRQLGPQPSAPTPVNLKPQNVMLETPALDTWLGKSRGMDSGVCGLPRPTEPYAAAAEATTYHIHPHQRHSLSSGPQQLPNGSPRETSTGTWRSLHCSDSSSHTADAAPPLTLQIPQPLDLQRLSTLNTPSLQAGKTHISNRHHSTASTPSTLLPSLSVLRDHAHRLNNVEEPKTASMLPLYHPQQQSIAPSTSSRNFSPPSLLKRHAEPSESEDLHSLKRLHFGAATEEARQSERRGSVDPTSRESRLRHSPPPTESIPGSAYPRLSSPSFGRYANHRTLPSPSSLANPTSTAPSLPPLGAAQSASSSATSYQPPSTINTASSSSATSQHIADLQHQVTLKSLSLQTLQSEYASLLQKLQRERVKSQTIEKKTSAADQEVNDLTSKNEDLAEQVKALETQLGESERKREDQRQEAAREKEQWGRMLDLSGRLQNRADGEKRRLLEEKNYLTQRLAIYEDDGSQRQGEQARRDVTQSEELHTDCHGARLDRHPDLTQRVTPMTQASPANNSERSNLEQENVTLRARVTALRVTLEGVRRHNEELEASTRGFLEQTGILWSNVSRALDDDESQGNRTSTVDRAVTVETRATRPGQGPDALRQTEPPQSIMSTRQPGLLEIYKDGKRSFANIAEVSRAKSAEPQGPGFHVPTTTSLPEELIKALGSVPTTLAPLQHPPPTTGWAPITPLSQNAKSAEPASGSVPTFPHGYIDHHRPAESLPRTHHSSNVEGNEEGFSSSSDTGLRSPETYNTEPEPSTTRPTTSQSVAVPVKPASGGFHCHSLHGHGQSVDWMPPPPKPEVSYAAHTGTHV